jgi:hypothetical protein
MIMTREQALQLLQQHLKNKNLIKHSLAVEACLCALAEKFGEDKEIWGITGLLHDLDYEETVDRPEEHGLKSTAELEKRGVASEIIQAIKAHNEMTKTPRKSKLDKAIYAVDPLTGLIVAATLVLPDKKLSSLTTESVLKRFKEKAFARRANREAIKSCQELGLTLEQFIKISLKAMQAIAQELDL